MSLWGLVPLCIVGYLALALALAQMVAGRLR
jgi:hypothetical protein